MRELKFRVWSEEDKEYRTDLNVFRLHGGKIVCTSPMYSLEGDRFDVEQYTGLKDKNGKEIYEGDVVEYMTCYYGNEKRHRKVVEWGEWDSDDFGEPHNLGYFNLSECMEVIGNIHENPELLSKEEE